jgi:hypothetical protein
VGIMNGRVTATPLSEVIVQRNPLPPDLVELYRRLAI